MRQLVLLALALVSGPVSAAEPAHENHFATGLFGSAYLVVGSDKAVHGHYGGGVFFEAHVVPHYLAIEVGLQVLSASGALELPFDVLFKVPFHVKPWCEPFVGLGPTFVPAIHGGVTSWHFGVAFVGGAYWWLHPHVGLLTTLSYNIIANSGAQHEVGLQVGPVFGF